MMRPTTPKGKTMNETPHVKYWSTKVEKDLASLDAIRQKLYRDSCTPLTVEETYALRELLSDVIVDGRFLLGHVNQTETKKSRIKRFFRK